MANTGKKKYGTLVEVYEDTLEPTGNTKPNEVGDPDYVAPVLDLNACSTTTTTTIAPELIHLDISNLGGQFISFSEFKVWYQTYAGGLISGVHSFLAGSNTVTPDVIHNDDFIYIQWNPILFSDGYNLLVKVYHKVGAGTKTLVDTFTMVNATPGIENWISIPRNGLGQNNIVYIEFEDILPTTTSTTTTTTTSTTTTSTTSTTTTSTSTTTTSTTSTTTTTTVAPTTTSTSTTTTSTTTTTTTTTLGQMDVIVEVDFAGDIEYSGTVIPQININSVPFTFPPAGLGDGDTAGITVNIDPTPSYLIRVDFDISTAVNPVVVAANAIVQILNGATVVYTSSPIGFTAPNYIEFTTGLLSPTNNKIRITK